MFRRILLVEPDHTIGKHLNSLLGTLGYTCRSVTSVTSALAEMAGQAYPLIIADLDLAGGDPAALAARLREACGSARLVGLDSTGDPCGDVPALNGFDAVISKPFLAEPLLATLPSLLPVDA